MGKQSSLGPIDPQFGGLPAHGVIEEFARAAKEISESPAKIAVWQPIIAKYHPTFIGECEKAIKWSEEIAREWLLTGMFRNLPAKEAKQRVEAAVKDLGDHALQKSHARHISLDAAKKIGLVVDAMEQLAPGDDAKSQQLQDAILSVHHSCIITLLRTDAYKIVQNQNGVAQISSVRQA